MTKYNIIHLRLYSLTAISYIVIFCFLYNKTFLAFILYTKIRYYTGFNSGELVTEIKGIYFKS